MFCTSCGKQIDDNSTFCSYCGNRIESSTAGTSNTMVRTANPSGKLMKKMVISLSVCLLAVLLIIGVIKLLPGGFGKILPAKIFDNKHDEQVDISLDDALEEYQKYLDSWKNREMDGRYLRAALVYLDNDDIPELIVWDDLAVMSAVPAGSFIYVLKYTASGLLNFDFDVPYVDIYYIPKNNEIYFNTWAGNPWYGFYDENLEKYSFEGNNLKLVENLYYSETYDDDGNITGVDASPGLSSDYTVSDYVKSREELVPLYDKFIEIRKSDSNDLEADIFCLYEDERQSK